MEAVDYLDRKEACVARHFPTSEVKGSHVRPF